MQSRRYQVYWSSVNRKHKRKTLHQRWVLHGHRTIKKDCWDASLVRVERVRSAQDFRWVTITSSTISTSFRILRNFSRQMTSTRLNLQLLTFWEMEVFRIRRSL